MSGLEKDYPNREKKAVDCPYPPYADDFSKEQHRYGPFQKITETPIAMSPHRQFHKGLRADLMKRRTDRRVRGLHESAPLEQRRFVARSESQRRRCGARDPVGPTGIRPNTAVRLFFESSNPLGFYPISQHPAILYVRKIKILIVLTSHDKLGETGKKTGFWQEEFAAPYYLLKDVGVAVTLASSKGGPPPFDPKSELPENLTEAATRFRTDPVAQADLRTQKSWSMFPPTISKPSSIPGDRALCGICPTTRYRSH